MLFPYLQHIFWIHHRPYQRHKIWRAVRQIQIWSWKFWILKAGGIKLFFDVLSDIFEEVFCMYFIKLKNPYQSWEISLLVHTFLDVVIMKIIHQSFWDIEDWHDKINLLVENKFRFFHMHCNKIFIEDCRSFIIRFRNKLSSWFIIRSESDIHPVSNVLHVFTKHWIVHEF